MQLGKTDASVLSKIPRKLDQSDHGWKRDNFRIGVLASALANVVVDGALMFGCDQ